MGGVKVIDYSVYRRVEGGNGAVRVIAGGDRLVGGADGSQNS